MKEVMKMIELLQGVIAHHRYNEAVGVDDATIKFTALSALIELSKPLPNACRFDTEEDAWVYFSTKVDGRGSNASTEEYEKWLFKKETK
jgi:hypothetical protein